MKNLFITTVMSSAMAILAIFGCAAQDNVAMAYDKFSKELDKGHTIMNKHIDYHDQTSGEVTGICIVNEFSLPDEKGSLIKDLTHAMVQDSENAYHSAAVKAGSKGVTYAIAYGTGKNDFELIGADNDMDFMVVCFKDKLKNDFRTSYAIEWKQDNNGNYKGKIYKIFGKKPEDFISNSSHKKAMLFSSNGSFTLNVDSLINMKGLNSLDSINNLYGHLKTLSNNLGNNYNFNMYSYSDDNKNIDNTTWLTTFAMYCNKFKAKVKDSPTKGSVYATELLQLCKQANGVINDSEKKLCVKYLKECQKCTNDTFMTGLIEEAINWLIGKNKDESHNATPNRKSIFLFA